MPSARLKTNCAVILCDRLSAVKSLCQAHYQRQRNLNQPWSQVLAGQPINDARVGQPCSVTGCPRLITKKHLCDLHYSRNRYENVIRDIARVSDEDRIYAPSAFVYLVAAPGWSPDGCHKIGRGTERGRSVTRLASLRTALPTAEYVRTVYLADAQALERALHQRFAGQHIAGEWFQVSPEEFDIAIAEIITEA